MFSCSALHLVFCYIYSLNCLTFHTFPPLNLNINNRFAIICFSGCVSFLRMLHNSHAHTLPAGDNGFSRLSLSRSFGRSTEE